MSAPHLEGLNEKQREAVETLEGPLLILAGAGSGKTRVITQRIAALVGRGVDPSAVVAVSFTNKAANEMAERMVPLVGLARARRIRMSTFHSFGLDLLKEEPRAGDAKARFVIFDQADSLGLVKEILRGTECEVIHLPRSSPPDTTLSTPGGRPRQWYRGCSMR